MRIICAGEAMGELRRQGAGFAVGFAGDTFNTSVYLRRLLGPGHQVAYLTRVGRDPLSQGFLDQAQAQDIDTSLVTRDPGRNIGLYAVQTDAAGERSFAYWRSLSAARQLFQAPEELEALQSCDLLLISGITLAILTPEARGALLDRVADLRDRGLRFAFDSNYRPALWEDAATARSTMERAWRLADISLPSVDDEMALHGDADAAGVLARLRGWGCRLGALKCGASGPLPIDPEEAPPQGLGPAPKVVDTTAAGDSFNAGWLAAWVEGAAPQARMARGHGLASFVVGQPGAIVDLPEGL